MKGIVAYDSVHGNTKQVAEAIAEQIRSEGHQVELLSVKEGSRSAVVGDFMFIGSPTRAGRMTREAKGFVENLKSDDWKDKPIVTFDTVGPCRRTWRSATRPSRPLKTVRQTRPRRCASCSESAA